jgi:hypothetical protein
MGIISAFLTDTATVKPYIRDGSGKPVFGTTYDVKCRIQNGKKRVDLAINVSGVVEAAIAEATMFTTGPAIQPKSVVTFGTREYIVITCNEKRGFGNMAHLEVLLQ